jgi:hypothetical protein
MQQQLRQPIYILDGEEVQKIIDLMYKLIAVVEIMFEHRKYQPIPYEDPDFDECEYSKDLQTCSRPPVDEIF